MGFDFDNAGGDVGGDGSVKWRFFAKNVRPEQTLCIQKDDGAVVHTAVDRTQRGQNFRIAIKLPARHQIAFLHELRRAVDKAEQWCAARKKKPASSRPRTAHRLRFTLPIEPHNEDQIQIRWTSAPLTAAQAKRAARSAKKAR